MLGRINFHPRNLSDVKPLQFVSHTVYRNEYCCFKMDISCFFFNVSVCRKVACNRFVRILATRGRASPSPDQIHLLLYSLSCLSVTTSLNNLLLSALDNYFPSFACVFFMSLVFFRIC